MDPEQGQNAQAAPQPQPQPESAPQPQPQASHLVSKPGTGDGFAEFKEPSHFNMPMALAWMVAVLAIMATLFFWWMNKNETDALADKKAEKDSLIAQITSPGSAEVEQKAADFKSSVTQLKTAYGDKYSYTDFLTGLNTKLTTDIKLNNIAVTSDGALNLTGTTKGYRAVADLMMALKSWDTLTDVDLLSVANNVTETKTETVFSIGAKINKASQKTAASTSGATGGANAAVQ